MIFRKGLTVSVCGKGGAGKTTLTALLLKALTEKNLGDILVIDADPAMNLGTALGIDVEGRTTLGMILDRKKEELDSGTSSYGKLMEAEIWESIIEQNGFDFLVVGCKRGEGCYCDLDSFAAGIIESLTKWYDFILIDFYAGFEHLSRRTSKASDILLIVTEQSKMGLATTRRIKELVDEVNLPFNEIFLLGNRLDATWEQELYQFSTKIGVKYAGIIPYDQNIAEASLKGNPLIRVPSNSPAYIAAKKLLETMLQESHYDTPHN
ncbi:MAG: AAA family ATPase [Candidatus Freyarchaeota archaeon]|nr:AAA family ATPase [Candidatus Jordarchaeia archaeon]MBS7268068.1 AAA family ATPase [Candidatus Jordarchaeia archaeon]MBS7279101.1 AAA family ATPase [Candidatus Jordarchaeia archaeon]